ncbi:urea amidolyase associated protein UAAP2 [Cellulomonas cellasea]|uniref:Urea carboxylase n=2 Tax=Cellulomonas cellasea TaxID=43670 RepID=A0A0A0B7J8_9CELL|nr:urea amidolyase associated protein UAAP2 [Cellulomonas cellasea]KGM02193.1 urea carboxylase [Cellulomonas cellasea DSM 20118]GEA88953.1 urea carboxylase [Cellulomonas cellasea]
MTTTDTPALPPAARGAAAPTGTAPAGTAPEGTGPSAPAALPAAATGAVVLDAVVPARAPWSAVVRRGQLLTIIDLGGNQAVDFLAFDAHDTSLRYSAPDTIQAQGSVFLTTGSVLRDCEHAPMMTLVADDCGRHDTLGGACSKESNTLRYGHHTAGQHACVENFLAEGGRHGLGKRDLVSNINWYMNVPVDPDGALGIVDGISAPGLSLTLRAEKDVLVVVSNCPQVNNPCNGFDPTPVRMVVTDPSEG